MEFRDAKVDDLEDIASLFHACWHIAYAEILSDEVIAAMTLESAGNLWRPSLVDPKDKETVIGLDAGSLVSVFRVGSDPSDGAIGHLFSLYVDPAAAGKGFGKKSLAEASLRLKNRGFSDMSLWVFADNAVARGLYTSAGFVESGKSRTDERWKLLEIELVKKIT
jgi:ribosomal protein S18 acetylase RimI-like enzyme